MIKNLTNRKEYNDRIDYNSLRVGSVVRLRPLSDYKLNGCVWKLKPECTKHCPCGCEIVMNMTCMCGQVVSISKLYNNIFEIDVSSNNPVYGYLWSFNDIAEVIEY